jgi:tellurite methyltransferase
VLSSAIVCQTGFVTRIRPQQAGVELQLSDDDRNKWNARYGESSAEPRREPSRFLQDWLPRLAQPPGASALDIGCGSGRNAHYLAEQRYRVDAMDISSAGLQRGDRLAEDAGLTLHWIERDLEQGLGLRGPYDLVIQFRYVNAGITAAVAELLSPGGVFICEQHLVSEAEVVGPRSREFRVAPGELKRLASPLELLHTSEELTADSDGRAVALSRLVARRRHI